MTLTAKEQAEVDAANKSGKTPVVFIHGLWLLHSSWDAWRSLFEQKGYATIAVDWPASSRLIDLLPKRVGRSIE